MINEPRDEKGTSYDMKRNIHFLLSKNTETNFNFQDDLKITANSID